jgi:hypothetical protein
MLYLDLAELPEIFDRSWFWSARHAAIAWYRRRDFLGPALHYETLVAEPELHVKRLCHFTGLDYDDRLIAIDSHNSSFDQSEDGIYQGSVGKWQACLSPEEAWWVQRINRTQMKKLGYETADISVSPLMITKILLSTPAALLRALKANNGRRGPLLPYLLKRIFPGKLTTRQQNRSKSQKVDGLAK